MLSLSLSLFLSIFVEDKIWALDSGTNVMKADLTKLMREAPQLPPIVQKRSQNICDTGAAILSWSFEVCDQEVETLVPNSWCFNSFSFFLPQKTNLKCIGQKNKIHQHKNKLSLEKLYMRRILSFWFVEVQAKVIGRRCLFLYCSLPPEGAQDALSSLLGVLLLAIVPSKVDIVYRQ